VSVGPAEPGNTPAQRVFISYRRQDSAAYAGRVYDAMVARFREQNVFMDLDLAPGVDFVERITEAVSACQVLIEVIGPTWATVKDDEGQIRIADPEDFVRLELEIALKRPEVTVIPVLVSGAQMPDRRDLPPELGAIARRNALELSDRRWRYDVGQLISTLEELLAETTAVHVVPTSADVAAKAETSPAPGPTDTAQIPPSADLRAPGKWLRGRGRLFAGIGALAVVVVALAIAVLGGGSGGGGEPRLDFEPFTDAEAFTVDVPAGMDQVHVEKDVGGRVINTELQSPDNMENVQISYEGNTSAMKRARTARTNRIEDSRNDDLHYDDGGTPFKTPNVNDLPTVLFRYTQIEPNLGPASIATFFFNTDGKGWRTRAAVAEEASDSADLAKDIATRMAMTLEPR
jgi:hypothetical protein